MSTFSAAAALPYEHRERRRRLLSVETRTSLTPPDQFRTVSG